MDGQRIITIRFPLPPQLQCELCPSERLGQPLWHDKRSACFTGVTRKGDYAKHLKNKHGIAAANIKCACGVCGYISEKPEATALKDVNAHLRRLHGIARDSRQTTNGRRTSSQTSSGSQINNNINNNSNDERPERGTATSTTIRARSQPLRPQQQHQQRPLSQPTAVVATRQPIPLRRSGDAPPRPAATTTAAPAAARRTPATTSSSGVTPINTSRVSLGPHASPTPPFVRVTRAERLRKEARRRQADASTEGVTPPSRGTQRTLRGMLGRMGHNIAPATSTTPTTGAARVSASLPPSTTYADAVRGHSTPITAPTSGETNTSSPEQVEGSIATTTSTTTLTTTTTTTTVCSGSVMATGRPSATPPARSPSFTPPPVHLAEPERALRGISRREEGEQAVVQPSPPHAANDSQQRQPTTPGCGEWQVATRRSSGRRSATPPAQATSTSSPPPFFDFSSFNLFDNFNNVNNIDNNSNFNNNSLDVRDTPRSRVVVAETIHPQSSPTDAGERVVVEAQVHCVGGESPSRTLAANNTGTDDRHGLSGPPLESQNATSSASRVTPVPRRGSTQRSNRRGGRRNGGGRIPSDDQRAFMDLANLAMDAQQLEEAATHAAIYLGRLSRREGGGTRRAGRHTRGRDGRRGERGNRAAAAVAVEPEGAEASPDDRAAWTAAAARIQKLYRKNRRRAVQEVIAGPPQHCEIGVEEVQRYFQQVHADRESGGALPPLFNAEDPSAASCAGLCAPFVSEEISRRLRSMSNSAPGPDGVSYADLKRADPGCHVLTALFNTCLRLGVVPRCWKNSSTVLLHKKGERDLISNWRPIAMGDTTAKLFSALIADRLTTWAVDNGRLSPSQKGFLQYEGCYEHNFVLQEIIRDAKTKGRELVVAWLDLTNAFGSVPHASIHEALRLHKVPEPIRNVIRSAYDGATTRIKTAGGITEPISILSGVRQGCPMSPIVFNLTLEPVIRALQATGRGYKLLGQQYNNLVYADDATLVSDSPEGMQALLRSAEDAAAAVGLSFNPAKCATLHLKGRGTARVRQTPFEIQGEVMRSLAAGEPYEHLGTPTGFQVAQTPISTIDELVEALRAVDRSLLAPWQKLEVVAVFILPRMDFCLRGSHVQKGPLKEADKLLKRMAKGWMHLPQRASAEMVFLPPSMGGAGLLPLADMADILTIVHAFKMLHSKDAGVSELARSSLGRVVSKRIGRPAAEQDLAGYLSGSLEGDFAAPSSDTTSMWSRARNAARRVSDMLSLRWRWTPERQEMSLECRAAGGRSVIVPPQARAQVVRRLRAALVDHYKERLLAKPDQGKVFEVTSRNKEGNHFVRDGKFTRFAEWRFIHRARLDVVPLNATKRWQTGGDKRCRKCGTGLETLPHVIQHCGPHSAAITRRHDAILNRLVRASHAPGTVSVNRCVEGVDEENARLRPDLVIRDETNKRVTIIDVAVPFENRIGAFDDARGDKLIKYHSLAENLRRQGYEVMVEAFLVGALGAWDTGNERALSLLKVNRRYAGMMRRLMVSDTIRWSRNIYVEHVSGIRQY